MKLIKCPSCGIYNKNAEHCINCGAILSYKKRREKARKKTEDERKKRALDEQKNNPSLFEKYENHRFLLVRVCVKVLRSIWLVFLAIGTFIAWLFTAIAA